MNSDKGTKTENENVILNLKSNLFSLLMLCVFLLFHFEGKSQLSLETLISNAKENNKTLIAANRYYEAEVIQAKTGNTPENPEVEYAYLWGTPEQIGERVDFAVTQSFDFPTAYTSRSKLSKINREQANLRLQTTEQEVIVRARKAWFNAVYLNQVKLLLGQRLQNAELIAQAFQRLYDEGEANQLQLNQAQLKATALSNEMNRLKAEIVANNAEISWLNGGQAFVVADTTFPASANLVLDTLLKLYQTGPRNAAFQGEVIRMEQLKDVAFNQKLPKLKAGYYQETILGTQLKGIVAGISIPLWADAHAVKAAKAGVVFAQTDAMRFWEQQKIQLTQMFERWLMLKAQVDEMDKLLDNSNNNSLLLKALERGEISLTQYYYESDFYFQNQFELFDMKRELYLLETELMRASY
jgi:hypothetical protein